MPDREVADVKAQLRAHTRVLNALRETQLEQGRQLTELREELSEEMRSEMGTLRSEMQQGFGTLSTGMAQIVALLTNRP